VTGEAATSDVLRQRLGRVGVWTSAATLAPAPAVREAAAESEELGYGALWYPEGAGREAFGVGALLLAWSRRIAVAPGIASIYARDATAMANGARALADAFPGRFALGLGVSHAPTVERRGHAYGPPVRTMRAYLNAMDAAPYAGAEPAEAAPRVLAALGPRMLELAAERTAGAHPYFVPVEHTAFARERLGPGPLLAVEQAVVLERDSGEARRVARTYVERYLALDNYRRNLLRLGWPEEELAGGGSDRLVDALVAWGDVDVIRARVRAHLDAGADHVCVQPLPMGDFRLDQLRELAPALLEL